jgi:hypothetical protein
MESLPEVTLLRDVYKGERQVKMKDTLYLPAAQSHIVDGMGTGQDGRLSYNAYKDRAVFHNFVADAVESYLGLLHYKPTQYILPEKMKFLLDSASISGESLDQLLRKIHTQQLITGRCGLLLDIDVTGSGNPYIALYDAESIINWDEGSNQAGLNALNLVVLNESQSVRDGFAWKDVERYRVLVLGDLNVNEEDLQSAVYSQMVVDYGNGKAINEVFVEPKIMGQSLNEIPFVFVNSKDVSATPDSPPLLGLANLCLAIYRGEADYRQSLHMQAQDTLVVVGGSQTDEATRVGAGAVLNVDIGGDAKFIGVGSSGLPEQRMCIQNDREAAVTKAGQLMNSNSKQESGDALKIRMAAQTANLHQVAVTSAYALENLLKKCARWMGIDDREVEVIPNLQFADKDMKGQDFAQLIAAKNTGLLPLCDETVHTILKEQGYTKLSYKDERKKIKSDELEPPIKPDSPDMVNDNVSNPSAQVTLKQQPING